MSNLTDEQMRQLLLIPCSSKEHLDMWLRTFLQVELLKTTVSRFASTNPLDAAWLVYERSLHSKTKEPLNILFTASRASQKTLLSAAVEIAILIHDRRPMLHYAGSLDQVDAGYKYIREFLEKKYVRDLLVGKVTNSGADLLIPDYKDPFKEAITIPLRVFPITPMSVAGQHAPALFIDELVTLNFQKLKAFYDLSGVPIPTRDGRPPIRVSISSRKGSFSLVETQIANAHKTKLKVAAWTIFELTQQCNDERSGIDSQKYFVNTLKGHSYSPEQYEVLTQQEQTGYQEIDAYVGCQKCPLLPICLGDAKKQTSINPHLRTIESVIQEVEQNTIEWVLSQRMSLAPSTEGLIYNKFKKETHIVDEAKMLEVLTGEKREYVTRTELTHKFKEMQCECYVGVDHTGGSAPATAIVIFVDKKGIAYLVDEVYEPGLELDDLIAVLKRLYIQYNYKMIFADTAAADKNKLIKKQNLPIYTAFKKDIDAGIEIVRSKIMSASGDISFYVLRDKMPETINEFGKYHYEEAGDGSGFSAKPAEEHSHAQDAIRYAFQNIFGRNGSFSAPEYSKQEEQGKQYDPVSEVEEMVKRRLKEAVQKETGDNTEVHSEGGFTWII